MFKLLIILTIVFLCVIFIREVLLYTKAYRAIHLYPHTLTAQDLKAIAYLCECKPHQFSLEVSAPLVGTPTIIFTERAAKYKIIQYFFW